MELIWLVDSYVKIAEVKLNTGHGTGDSFGIIFSHGTFGCDERFPWKCNFIAATKVSSEGQRTVANQPMAFDLLVNQFSCFIKRYIIMAYLLTYLLQTGDFYKSQGRVRPYVLYVPWPTVTVQNECNVSRKTCAAFQRPDPDLNLPRVYSFTIQSRWTSRDSVSTNQRSTSHGYYLYRSLYNPEWRLLCSSHCAAMHACMHDRAHGVQPEFTAGVRLYRFGRYFVDAQDCHSRLLLLKALAVFLLLFLIVRFTI